MPKHIPNDPAVLMNPQTGRVDLDKYQKTIKRAVERTRNVLGETELPQGRLVRPAAPDAIRFDGFLNDQGEPIYRRGQLGEAKRTEAAFRGDFATQREVLEEEANRAADALQVRGAASVQKLRDLRRAREKFLSPEAEAEYMKRYEDASKLAETYVNMSNVRASQFTKYMNDLMTQQTDRLDVAKAQDIESAVYSLEGQLKQEEQAYLAADGNDADFEVMQDFIRQKRAQQHGVIRSAIAPAYAKLEQDFAMAHMNATATGQAEFAMHTSFREQQHIDAKLAEASAAAKYRMDAANLDMVLSEAEGTEMEDMMNWIIASPVSSMETLPMLTAIMELNQAQEGPWR